MSLAQLSESLVVSRRVQPSLPSPLSSVRLEENCSVRPFIHTSVRSTSLLQPLRVIPPSLRQSVLPHVHQLLSVKEICCLCVGKTQPPWSSSPPGGSRPGALRGHSVLPQRLLQSVAVRLVSADHRLPLLVLLLVQDPQEVAQLRDGEGIPLGTTEEEFQWIKFMYYNYY